MSELACAAAQIIVDDAHRDSTQINRFSARLLIHFFTRQAKRLEEKDGKIRRSFVMKNRGRETCARIPDHARTRILAKDPQSLVSPDCMSVARVLCVT